VQVPHSKCQPSTLLESVRTILLLNSTSIRLLLVHWHWGISIRLLLVHWHWGVSTLALKWPHLAHSSRNPSLPARLGHMPLGA